MGHNYQEHAVLYRSNAQSRVIEEQLTRANIPYIISEDSGFSNALKSKTISVPTHTSSS